MRYGVVIESDSQQEPYVRWLRPFVVEAETREEAESGGLAKAVKVGHQNPTVVSVRLLSPEKQAIFTA